MIHRHDLATGAASSTAWSHASRAISRSSPTRHDRTTPMAAGSSGSRTTPCGMKPISSCSTPPTSPAGRSPRSASRAESPRPPHHVDPLDQSANTNRRRQTMKLLHHTANPAEHDASDECTESAIERSTQDLVTAGEPAVAQGEPARGPVWRVVGGSTRSRIPGRTRAHARRLRRSPRARHLRLGAARVRLRLGDARPAIEPLHQPTAEVGPGAGSIDGGRSARSAGLAPERSGAQRRRLGLAAGGARARHLDGRAASSQPHAAEFAGCSTRSWRRSSSAPSAGCTRPSPGHMTRTPTRARHAVRRRWSPAPPELLRIRQPHRRAPERARRDVSPLDSHHRRSGSHHSCVRLRPRRSGLERRRRPVRRTASPSPPTCTPCSDLAGEAGPYVLVGHSAGGPTP